MWNLCAQCDRPLKVVYDLEEISRRVRPEILAKREPTMWRYRELLPLVDPGDAVTLGETMTPLLRADRLGQVLGLKNLWIKDESRLPTGSFKARGMAMAVSKAREFGLRRLAVPTAGNAGGALAAYAARAGMEAHVFMPHDTPVINQRECLYFGADLHLVDGLINDCARLVKEAGDRWFDLSTLKEPYRLEGKKTMGLELAEQMDWRLPDWIFYPTGGGTGLVGMWKAFEELGALGWLRDSHRPRMVVCQSSGCAPMVRAYERQETFATPWESPRTAASGIRVPAAVGDFMILQAVRESSGLACENPEDEIGMWMKTGMETEGISFCPETAVCLASLSSLVSRGKVGAGHRVVVFNTGAAQKYQEVLARDVKAVSGCHRDER